MPVDLVWENNIESIDGKNLFLPNSVYVVGGVLIISDGGNNRVCVQDINTQWCIGNRAGLGKYLFKEPVYAMKYENDIYICDWHNHRITKYTGRKFDQQIGLFGSGNDGLLKSLFLLLKSFSIKGSYIRAHFPEIKKNVDESRLEKIALLIQGATYYAVNPGIFVRNIRNNIFVNKPNGCAVFDGNVVFTQKNNKTISVYDKNKKKLIKNIYNPLRDTYFGRLGQLCVHDELLYVCDESNNIIWVFDVLYKLVDRLSLTSYKIFSISVSDQYIALCGETSFTLLSSDYETLYESSGEGEYHGVSIDGDYLYVVNRLNDRVEKYCIHKKL